MKPILIVALVVCGSLALFMSKSCASDNGHGSSETPRLSKAYTTPDVTDFGIEAGYGGVVVVDFTAPWCPACKSMKPVFARFEEEMGGKAKLVQVNIDKYSELAIKYKVEAIPTMLIFRDGKIVQTLTGYQKLEDLVKATGL